MFAMGMESTHDPLDQRHSGSLLRERYELIRKLGEGGFATTYFANDRRTGRGCVVKELSWEKVDDWKFIELFEREARVLANLNHPQIPAFIEFFTEPSANGSHLFLVQEFIDGQNLRDLIRNGKHFTEHEVVEIAMKIAGILQYLHQLSPPIIHRDIKPSNILIDSSGEVHLVDFGAVRDKVLHSQKTEGDGFTVVGTYGYMPFEQFQGKAAPASDIYSLGATLLYMLSHKEPDEIESIGSRLDLEHHISASPGLMAVLRKMMEHDSSLRYQSAGELTNDLQALLDHRTPLAAQMREKSALTGWRLTALVLLIAALGGGLWSLYRLQAVPRKPVQIVAPVKKQALMQPAREGDVPGRLFYDNQPVTEFTNIRPRFWFRNEDTGKAVTAEAEYRDGAFLFTGLPPGNYGVQTTIDAFMENPSIYPGDFYAWTPFTVSENQNAELRIEMQKVIHLRSPEDNGKVMPHWSINPDLMKVLPGGKVHFKWDSLGPEVYYDYSIATMRRPYEHQGAAASGTTSETEITIDLPQNSPNDYYLLTLYARKNGRNVGQLITHGSNGMGWDYRFRVNLLPSQ